MIEFLKVMVGLMPPDTEDRKQMAIYHRHISIAVSCMILILAVIVLPAMFYTVPKIGNLVWAADVEGKIKREVDPVKQEIADIKPTLLKILQQQNQQFINSKASEIRTLVARRCLTKIASERSAFFTEIDVKRQEFRDLAGYDYNPPKCEDL